MRWIWIDRFIEFHPRKRCVSIKNVTLAEDVLHDHFPATADHPATPVMPNTLVIEGMAQTAGILVGQANQFTEKVILAKINQAVFHLNATPGFTMRFTAHIERLDQTGASTKGVVDLIDPADQSTRRMAEIDLMFSHIDRNRAGLAFPDHNFVFTKQFTDLLHYSGIDLGDDNATDPNTPPPVLSKDQRVDII